MPSNAVRKGPVRKSNYDFHSENMSKLKNIGDRIQGLTQNILNQRYYERKEGRGFWMLIKETYIMNYIQQYLMIQRGQPDKRPLSFVDLMSSNGMVKLKDERYSEELTMPGSTMIAAMQNLNNNKYFFDRIYANSLDPEDRACLIKRIECLNKSPEIVASGNEIITYIPPIEDGEVNSNDVIDKFIEDMKKFGSLMHYLAVIDNERYEISYDTLRKLRTWNRGNFGDLIINYQPTGLFRSRGIAKKLDTPENDEWEKINAFFGTHMEDIPQDQWLDKYISQLNKIGLANVEPVDVKAGDTGYYYKLLFCVRELGSKAPWLKMIRNYRDNRFINSDGRFQKQLWYSFIGKEPSLDTFLKIKKENKKEC